MTAAFRAGVTATGAASSAAATIPSAIVAGDVMLLVVSFKAATGGASINTPAGWAVLAGPVNMTGATGQGALFTRVADGTDGGSTLTVTGTGASQQLDYALAGWSASNGIIRASGFVDLGASSSTSIACASQTSVAGDLIALVAATRGAANGAYSFTAPGGYTVEAQVSSAAGGAQNMGAVICDGTATGSQTVTASIAVWAIAGQVVIEATNIPIQPVRRRVYPLAIRRREGGAPPVDQASVPQCPRPRLKFARRPAVRVAGPVPTQAVIAAPPYPPRGVRARIRGVRLTRGRSASPPSTQDIPVRSARPRVKVVRATRARAVAPVPPQTVLAAPAYPPRGVRVRLAGVRAARPRRTQVVPPQISAAAPAYPSGRVRQAVVRMMPARRARNQAVPPPQILVPVRPRQVGVRPRPPCRRRYPIVPPAQDFVAAKPRRSRPPVPRRAARARNVVPPQVPPPPAPAILAQGPRARRIVVSLRRRQPTGVWAAVVESCIVVRPNTGTVGRPGSGTVTRPNSGTVTRTTTGYVIRPDTGTVDRPGCE